MGKKQIASVLFGLALALQALSLFTGWNLPILEEHSFRQTQTAFGVWSILQGGNWLRYETPVLGAPWAIPFEFPLYQWTVALAVKLFSSSLEETGRVIARLYYLLAIFFVNRILLRQLWDQWERRMAMALLLLAPVYLFWSRTFLIETAALAACLAYVDFVLAWEKQPKKIFFWTAIIFAWFAGTAKATTFLPFGVGLGIYFISKFKSITRVQRLKWVVLLGLPWFFAVFWSAYSDLVKSANPLADFISSKSLMLWNFGLFSDRFDKDFWYMIFRHSLHDAGGHRSVWILMTFAALFLAKVRRIYFFYFFLFLLAPLVFLNLHRAHTYYLCANGIFLVLAYIYVLRGYLQSAKFWQRGIGVLLALFTAFSMTQHYRKFFYPVQQRNNSGVVEFGKIVEQLTEPNDVLLIYGADWHPMYAYYSHRRAIMDRETRPLSDPAISRSLQNLQTKDLRIGAVLACGNAVIPASIQERFRLDDLPAFRHLCSIYPVKP